MSLLYIIFFCVGNHAYLIYLNKTDFVGSVVYRAVAQVLELGKLRFKFRFSYIGPFFSKLFLLK